MSSGTNQERLQQNNQELQNIKDIIDTIPDTYDATAKASDILEGKTAYMKGRRVTGTLETTYRTINGGPHTVIEGTFNSTNAIRALAMSYKFGIALVRTSAAKYTTQIYLATINKETGAFNRTNYIIKNTDILPSGYSTAYTWTIASADIAQQLNEDGTIRFAFVLSDLVSQSYHVGAYIVACDYNLTTHTITKTYKVDACVHIGDGNLNAYPAIIRFCPTSSNIFVVFDEIDKPEIGLSYKMPVCFINSNGLIEVKPFTTESNTSAIYDTRTGHQTWSENGKHLWVSGQSLYSSSQYQYNGACIVDVDYDTSDISVTQFKGQGYGYMVWLNDNTLFELKYNKQYNIYSRSGATLTKIKTGTVNMNIYYKSPSSASDLSYSVCEMQCLNNNIFYVDGKYFNCITLDNEFNITNVEQLNSNYTTFETSQADNSPYLSRRYLITKVEDGKYVHSSDKNMYFVVFDTTGTEKISTVVRDGTTLYNPELMSATSANLLLGKTAVGNNGIITGSMPNNGALNYTPSDTSQTIPAGYTSGGTVSAVDYASLGTLTPQELTQAEGQIADLFGEGVS